MNRWLPAALLLALLPLSVHAHRLKVFAAADGEVIRGSVYFVGGGECKDVAVHVQTSNGEPLGKVTTDAAGGFVFTPKQAVAHRFVVRLANGHQADCTVSAAVVQAMFADVSPPSSPPSPASAAAAGPPATDADAPAAAATAAQVRELRRDLQRLEEHLRWRDVLGAVGYIFGLFGFVVLFKARSRRDSHA
jgi:nickel transport protein